MSGYGKTIIFNAVFCWNFFVHLFFFLFDTCRLLFCLIRATRFQSKPLKQWRIELRLPLLLLLEASGLRWAVCRRCDALTVLLFVCVSLYCRPSEVFFLLEWFVLQQNVLHRRRHVTVACCRWPMRRNFYLLPLRALKRCYLWCRNATLSSPTSSKLPTKFSVSRRAIITVFALKLYK